ncbi:MAG: single-stranded-DNA-specific exonuclease RecJ [Candidatus Eisenbacteria bacterium]|uniref:Single-stranded-DNA-specific exonuclease RecJ n=1 Tax=Eiseniibacteriota bacterium TaxID=2212470 RepID=A0A956SBE5_UNCEI|nr:single-stranded-DNA-specific exonuclease RecJ [Candidatus Eisenbacteria bacterium]MCB9462972.1 single-stranded-DNA-specific exonuclease RecJ [Candidatus Eisenbacteria bacterium]
MKSQWILPTGAPPPEWKRMESDWGIPTPILDVLWNRGLRERGEVEAFLRPSLDGLHDPFLLQDMDRAVARVHQALQGDAPIVVFGDYDVDGVTSSALLSRVLTRFGATVRTLLPNRFDDGYGLNKAAIERADALGAKLLIVADCGTTQHDPIAFANERGIDVVVCDHHMPESSLPPAHALINPRRTDDAYPFADLAAVGVSFKLLQGLVRAHGNEEIERYLLNQLDLVALGTVADVVPLVDENRILTHFGIRVLRLRRRAAFEALMEQARLQDKHLDSSHLAFSLAPRLNAAGRLGDATRALDLLLEEELGVARRLASALEEVNSERKSLNERVQQESLDTIGDEGREPLREAIVLGSTEWHPGVLGIAASRLVGQFHVPVMLVSLTGEIARGSARAPHGIDLLEILEHGAEFLTTFGGHRRAAGFSLAPEAFPAFQAAVTKASRAYLETPLARSLGLDAALEPSACDLELARWVERLGPFGEGNPEPLFLGRGLCRGVRVLKERHLKLQVFGPGCQVECIGFGLGEFAAEIPDRGAHFRLAFTPTVNRYRGQERLQLKLREIDFV